MHLILFIRFFFFSSRRRHTRWNCDWSSDVCSSDLWLLYYFIQSPNHNNQWMSYIDRNRKINEPHENEFSLFFKDDWKIHPSFTLNAGIRYEWYGVPYEGQGLTIAPIGGQGGLALFGVSGRSFDRWMRTDNGVDLNLVSQVEFVGPKTS